MILFTNVVFPLKAGPAIRIVVGCRNAITHAIYQCNKCEKYLTMYTVGVFILTFLFSGTIHYFLLVNLTAGIRKLEQDIFLLLGKEANAYANNLN